MSNWIFFEKIKILIKYLGTLLGICVRTFHVECTFIQNTFDNRICYICIICAYFFINKKGSYQAKIIKLLHFWKKMNDKHLILVTS